MCHVSRVACHMPPVTCKKKNLHFFYNTKKINNNNPTQKIGQSGGANRWRVCYQRGLPRLVFKETAI